MSYLQKASQKYILINQIFAKKYNVKPIIIEYIRSRNDHLQLNRTQLIERQHKKIKSHLFQLDAITEKMKKTYSKRGKIENTLKIDTIAESLKLRGYICLFLQKITDKEFSDIIS